MPPPDPLNVILYEEILLQPDADIEEVAEEAMARALKTTKDEFVGDHWTYGNEPGVGLLQGLRELRQNGSKLEARLSTLEEDVHLLKAEHRTF